MEEIARALVLLAALGIQDVPSIQVVDRTPEFNHLRPVATVAYTLSCEPPIYVLRSADAFREAGKGDARRLAAAIAHEMVHIRQGPYEAPAYSEELRVLKVLNIGGDALNRVREAAELHSHDRP